MTWTYIFLVYRFVLIVWVEAATKIAVKDCDRKTWRTLSKHISQLF